MKINRQIDREMEVEISRDTYRKIEFCDLLHTFLYIDNMAMLDRHM